VSGGLPGTELGARVALEAAAWERVAAALQAVSTAADARRVLAGHDVTAGLLGEESGARCGPEILVTGDLKAGRSTLLNALVGEPRLRTAVRTCTQVPVSVWAHGAWWTELPPSKAAGRRPGDGRVVVVDVRQPLPRAVQLAGCAGPTVVVCTKADRALEDAVLSDDPEGELDLARRVASRRASERLGALEAWIDCDPRDRADVEARVWPALREALKPAWDGVSQRRTAARAQSWSALVERLRGPERPPVPDSVDVGELTVALCRAELGVCMTTLEADLAAVEVRLSTVDSHVALDALVDELPALLAAAVLQCTRAVTAHRRARWADSLARVAERVDGAWQAHLGLDGAVRTAVRSSAAAPGFGAELPVGRWKVAAAGLEGTVGGFLGRASRRLRAVSRRRADLLDGWRALASELVQVVGDAAWQERWRVESALADVAADQLAWMAVVAQDAERQAVLLARARGEVAGCLHRLGASIWGAPPPL